MTYIPEVNIRLQSHKDSNRQSIYAGLTFMELGGSEQSLGMPLWMERIRKKSIIPHLCMGVPGGRAPLSKESPKNVSQSYQAKPKFQEIYFIVKKNKNVSLTVFHT